MALAYYCAAVASARLGNANQLAEYLAKAVEEDPTLKDKALDDLEFAQFAANDQFRNAIK
jgi:hypothetical protein